MLKTHQWYQSLGLFVCYLCLKVEESRKSCCLTDGLGESMGRTRRVHVYLQPTRRVGLCTRRVGSTECRFSTLVAGNGLETLP